MLHQLYIIRSQIELAIAAAEMSVEASAVPQDGPPVCPHPEDRRVPASNMGEAAAFFCQVCKETVQA